MPRFTDRITDFVRSPKGQELIDKAKEQANKAKEQANKPENREKIEKLAQRINRGGKSSGR